MKTLPPTLQAKLDSGVTTLCNCWRVERRDGLVLGFTDHDRDLVFGGVTYRAGSGFTASTFVQREGLSVDTMEARSALAADTLTEADLAAGLWDGAACEIWRVDWDAAADRVLLQAGVIGEVERGPAQFTCELRSLSHRLNLAEGRLYSVLCDATLGDARCGFDLAAPGFSATAAVSAVQAAQAKFSAAALSPFATGFFSRGKVTFSSGANAAAAMEVKLHLQEGAQGYLALMDRMAFPVAAGDLFTVTAGCDKRAGTCGAKFGNMVNFRGFPHMPGNDFITSYPNRGERNDGGALNG